MLRRINAIVHDGVRHFPGEIPPGDRSHTSSLGAARTNGAVAGMA